MSYVFAKRTCSVAFKGRPVTVVEGEVWAADAGVVKAHPDCFASEPPVVRGKAPDAGPVEQATAAPGEKRSTRRAKSSDQAGTA